MPRVDTPFESQVRSILSVNKVFFFVTLTIITFLLLYVEKTWVLDEIAAVQYMNPAQKLVFEVVKGVELIAIPLNMALQFTVVGFILWVGCFLWGYRVTYYECWKIAMIASLIFLVPQILKILWFTSISTDPKYQEVSAFYPLSIMNFFHYSSVAEKYWYAYKALNVFQIVYWFVLIKGVDMAARKRRNIAKAIIFTSYVPIFLFWLWYVTAIS